MDRDSDSVALDLSSELWRSSYSGAATAEIDFGTPEARSHLLEGWSHNGLWDGETPFVWADQMTSRVRLELYALGPVRFKVRCRPLRTPGDPPQVVNASLNGVGAPPITLADGFAIYELTFPEAATRFGENVLELRYDYTVDEGLVARRGDGRRSLAVAWDWLRVVGGDVAEDGAPLRPARPSPGELFLPYSIQIDYFVQTCPDSRLVWAARPSGLPRSAPEGHLHLDLTLRHSSSSRSFDITADSLMEDGSVVIGSAKPTLARLSLVALPRQGEPRNADGITVMGPRVVSADARCKDGIDARLPPSAAEGDRPDRASRALVPQAQPNIIVYLVDTLRGDRLGVHGYDRPTSPAIDRFASDGVTFLNAYAQSGWTKTSVASILTGLLPTQHGVLGREDFFPSWVPGLPGLLGEAGYLTYAASTSVVISPYFGFDSGFDTFEKLEVDRRLDRVFARSEEINDHFLAWLDARPTDRPFFAYLHSMDPHDPYLPPASFRARFETAAARPKLELPSVEAIYALLGESPETPVPALRDYVSSLYDAAIAYNDEQFGELLEQLKRRGLYESSIILFVSDHGEEFYEHGGWGHGKTLYREVLHVPLIVKFPSNRGSGTKVSATAQQVDILPSLLLEAGLDPPPGTAGLPLQRLVAGETQEAEVAWVSSFLALGGARAKSLIADGMHLIWKETTPDGGELELYNVVTDPREEMDIRGEDPVLAGFLRSYLTAISHRLHLQGEVETVAIDEEMEMRLRALGYM